MKEAYCHTTELRYERKFTIANSNKATVLAHIKKHPAFFREIYHPRQITNIYLDTSQYQFYNDNEVGIANRKKVRVRWYGNVFGRVQNPKLEYKLKVGLAGNKRIYPLPDFEVEKGFTGQKLQTFFDRANLPAEVHSELRQLRPTLLNTYQRSYYQSADKQFRLTLDEDLTYYQINFGSNQFLREAKERLGLVVELKYAPEQEKLASRVATELPYRLDKKSKYVTGIEFFKK